MSKSARIAIIAVLAFLVAGIITLALLDIRAPTTRIEKVIPDDHFQR